MEAAHGAPVDARNGGVSLPLMSTSSSSSSHPSRKDWRVVSEQSVRNSGSEELERSKLGPSDERLIYEVQRAREPLDTDFCSITIDGSFDDDILQQRLHNVVKQREELQQMEIELRAQVIARSEIVGLQNTFEAQMKEHANATIKFQDQLHEKEQKIHELERKIEEKERELHTIRLDNEAQAWAKEDLLREQSKELQSYRRERDNAEAERSQHIKQLHELQEHFQEKERQLMELQEQHRIAQETVLFKDEQIREAQAWMARAQEMDALQSTTNHTLQAELRERTEQYNQLWIGCQRQFGEMERLHLHLQQLRLELVDARGKSESHSDAPGVSSALSNDNSPLDHANGGQEVKENTSPTASTINPQNGISETSGGNASSQTDLVHGVAFASSSLYGMPTYLPTALHPFVMHQQGVAQSSHVTQSHFHPLPAVSPIQNGQSQQIMPDTEHGGPTHNQYPEQAGENLLRTGPHYEFEASVNGQVLHANYLDTQVSRGMDDGSLVPSSNEEQLVHGTINESHDNIQSQPNLQHLSLQFHEALGLDARDHGNETKENNANLVGDHGVEKKTEVKEHNDYSLKASSSEGTSPENFNEPAVNSASTVVLSNAFVSNGQKSNPVGKPEESYLLDERALLASIARTIGSGGRIRISSTLPNRLGKMLAPLHWHDYKRKYGKLDDFIANHPDLFLIEGDYIQLREGAQEIIAATAAVAKVAAASAVPSSHSSSFPSVALTPMAQSHRLKKGQNANDGSFHVSGGAQNVKVLSKSKDHIELNGSETRINRSVLLTVGNRTSTSRVDHSRSKGPSHEKPGVGLLGKQHSRVQDN